MALIIPEAQTPFSPVEQPRLNPNMPSMFDGIGAVSDSLIQVQAQKVKAENDRLVREARLTAMEGLDQARFRYETDTNLEGLTGRWQSEADGIAAKVAEGLPAHLRRDFQTGVREMIAPQTSAIRRREYALFQDRETAAMNNDLRRIENLAARAPTEEAREAVLREAGEVLDRAYANGLISAVERDRSMADIPASADRIAAMAQVEEDPDAFLEDLAGGRYAFLPPDQRKSFELAAKRNSAATAARQAREDRLIAEATDKEIGERVDAAIRIYQGGLTFDHLPQLLQEAQGTKHFDRLQSAVEWSAESADFGLQSPAEQKRRIAEMTARPTGNPSDVARLNQYREAHQQAVRSIAEDPIAHVRDRGILKVQPINLADPANVSARIAAAETVKREFDPDPRTGLRYLDKAEAAELAATVDGPDVDRALATLTGITRAFGDRAPAVFAQIGAADTKLTLAGSLVAETGEIAAARTLLQGRKLTGNDAAKPTETIRRAVRAELAAAFPDADRARLNGLIDAADAHYAAAGAGIADPKSPDALAAYRRSAQAVSAGVMRNGTAYGGIQPVHGRMTLLPPSLTATAAETALTKAGEAAWRQASQSGGLPMWGEKTPLHQVKDREDLTLLSLGSGLYAVGYRRRSGAIEYLRDPAQADGVFRFDLGALVGAVDD